ncbi:MAG: hypothetical protein PW792_15495 [Acidobacteriaceae bacterium]|nr:hypothetical protein [Acidobacteriaceae bacterium]
MKLFRSLVCFAVVVAGMVVRAQAQAIPTATGPGLFFSAGVAVSAFHNPYGDRNLGGITAFGGLHLRSRVSIEAEARFLRFHTDEDVTQTHVLVGPSVTILRKPHLQPYAKFLVGGGYMTFPFHYATGSYFAMAPGAGLDIPLNSRITVRLIDVEYQFWPQFTYGNLHPYGISSGISIRLTRPNIFRKDPYVY